MIVHGGLSGQPTPLPGGRYAPVWMRHYTVFEVTGDPAALRRAEHFVRSGLATGAFAPTIDRVFDFDDIAAAHVCVDSADRARARQTGGSGPPLTSHQAVRGQQREHSDHIGSAEGHTMLAIVAAVIFGLALLFELTQYSINVITGQLLVVAGLLALSLHLAGVGTRTSGWRRSRR